MQENLNEMIQTLNSGGVIPTSNIPEKPEEILTTENNPPEKIEEKEINAENKIMEKVPLINFYDWFEANAPSIHNVLRVKAEVSNINPKDNMIFKVKKNKSEQDMELVSFYNPSIRPILNLPPVYLKIFKNDTFESLHQFNNEIFIKCYGVKTGLFIIFCVNVNGKIIPYQKEKIKKNCKEIEFSIDENLAEKYRQKLLEDVEYELVQVTYKQAIKFKDEFTTKEKTVEWFLKRASEVIDINHLLKIDFVLISVI